MAFLFPFIFFSAILNITASCGRVLSMSFMRKFTTKWPKHYGNNCKIRSIASSHSRGKLNRSRFSTYPIILKYVRSDETSFRQLSLEKALGDINLFMPSLLFKKSLNVFGQRNHVLVLLLLPRCHGCYHNERNFHDIIEMLTISIPLSPRSLFRWFLLRKRLIKLIQLLFMFEDNPQVPVSV